MLYTIRPEQPADYEAITHLVTAAFRQPVEATLIHRLRAAGDHVPGLCLVAEQDGSLLGHIFYSRGWVETATGQWPILVLAPLAVRPDRQRQGIGQALIQASLTRARQAGYRAVSVLGDPAYYPRTGFQPAGKWGIEAPFSAPPEAFMAQELQPGALTGYAGRLQYAPAFDGLDG